MAVLDRQIANVGMISFNNFFKLELARVLPTCCQLATARLVTFINKVYTG